MTSSQLISDQPSSSNKTVFATSALAFVIALAVALVPRQAQADSGETAAAVLVGAALLYAAHDSHKDRHRYDRHRKDRHHGDYHRAHKAPRYYGHRQHAYRYDRHHGKSYHHGYQRNRYGYGHRYDGHYKDRYRHDRGHDDRKHYGHKYKDHKGKNQDWQHDRGRRPEHGRSGNDRDYRDRHARVQANARMHHRF